MGIFKLMFRDAVAWFILIAALISWNAFSWLAGTVGCVPIRWGGWPTNRCSARIQRGTVFLGIPFIHAGASIGGSRLLLNLGKAYYVTKEESIVCRGITPSTSLQWQTPQTHELRIMTGTLRSYPTTSTTAFVGATRNRRKTPYSSPQTTSKRSSFPFSTHTEASTPLSPAWTPRQLASTAPAIPRDDKDNALQIDLGFGHGAGFGLPDGAETTHYSYAGVWVDHPRDLWVDSNPRGWRNDRPVQAEDWPLRSRSRSKSRQRRDPPPN